LVASLKSVKERASLFGDVRLPERGLRDVIGAANDDAGVLGGGVEVIGDGLVDDRHAAFVAVRGGVGKIGAVFES